MALSADRIVAATMTSMRAAGFDPDSVAVYNGKSAMELFAKSVADAVVSEIKEHGVVKVDLDKSLATWLANGVVVASDGGASLKTTLATADTGGAYSKSSGGME